MQFEIGTWAVRTFPHQTTASIVAHLRREVEELAEAGDDLARGYEAADCVILLYALCHRLGIDLDTFVREKHGINIRRQWATPDAEGVVEHVRPTPAIEHVNHPAHYTAGGIEVVDYLRAKLTPEELRGFLRGNALKYLSRAGLKGDAATDYRKARWYVEALIAAEEAAGEG